MQDLGNAEPQETSLERQTHLRIGHDMVERGPLNAEFLDTIDDASTVHRRPEVGSCESDPAAPPPSAQSFRELTSVRDLR